MIIGKVLIYLIGIQNRKSKDLDIAVLYLERDIFSSGKINLEKLLSSSG